MKKSITEAGDAPKARPDNDKVRRSLDMQNVNVAEKCDLEETFDLEATVALETTNCPNETFSEIDATLLKGIYKFT